MTPFFLARCKRISLKHDVMKASAVFGAANYSEMCIAAKNELGKEAKRVTV